MKTILFIVVLLGLSCSLLFGWGQEFNNSFDDIQRFIITADRGSERYLSLRKNLLDKNGILDSLDAKSSLSLVVTVPSSRRNCWVGRGEPVAYHCFTFFHFLFDGKDSLFLQIRWELFVVFIDSPFDTSYYKRRKATFAFNKKKVGKDIWFGTDEEKILNDYYWTHKLFRFSPVSRNKDGIGSIIEVFSREKRGTEKFLKMYKSFSTGSDSAMARNLKVFCDVAR